MDGALATAEAEALRLRAMTDLDECEKTLTEVSYQANEAGFLERLFTLLGNLDDDGGKRGLDGRAGASRGSFLTGGGSMFRPMLELLFARLAADDYRAALSKVGRAGRSDRVPDTRLFRV